MPSSSLLLGRSLQARTLSSITAGSAAVVANACASMPIGNTPSRTSRPLVAYPVDVRGLAEHALHRGDEVAHVRRGVKADEVGAQQPFEDGFAVRQRAEHLGRRERDVQEEADLRVGDALAAACGARARAGSREPRPDRPAGSGTRRRRRSARSRIVDRRSRATSSGSRFDQVVEERPEHAVGVAFSTRPRSSSGGSSTGTSRAAASSSRSSASVGVVEAVEWAGPTDPKLGRCRVSARQARWRRRPGSRPTLRRRRDANGGRQAIGDDAAAASLRPTPARRRRAPRAARRWSWRRG